MLTLLTYPTCQTAELIKFFDTLNLTVTVPREVRAFETTEIVILPNGEDFQQGIAGLSQWQPELKKFVVQGGLVVGLGLGLHLLGEGYAEPDFITGLGLLPGVSYPLPAEENYPVPAQGLQALIGLNEQHPLTRNLTGKTAYYDQTHYFDGELEQIIALSQGALKFPAIIQEESIIGLQFNPELSGNTGQIIFKNILAHQAN